MAVKVKRYYFEISYLVHYSNTGEIIESSIGGDVKSESPDLILTYAKNFLKEINENVEQYLTFLVWENFGKGELIISEDISTVEVL